MSFIPFFMCHVNWYCTFLQASGRKKVIPLIPAMPSKRSGRGGTRMQDAGAALSRNKLLKIVSVRTEF